MSETTLEEKQARYAAMKPDEIDTEVARLRAEAIQLLADTVALENRWRQERVRRANLRTVK